MHDVMLRACHHLSVAAGTLTVIISVTLTYIIHFCELLGHVLRV